MARADIPIKIKKRRAMKKAIIGFAVLVVFCAVDSKTSSAGSLSASLGATQLDGLTDFSNCQTQTIGYREALIADRLELKLGQSPALTPQERNIWIADIQALRNVWNTKAPFVDPDPALPQHYFLGL